MRLNDLSLSYCEIMASHDVERLFNKLIVQYKGLEEFADFILKHNAFYGLTRYTLGNFLTLDSTLSLQTIYEDFYNLLCQKIVVEDASVE